MRLLEIGVKDGASLKMWDDFFTHPEAKIFGADIVKKSGGIDESRIIQARRALGLRLSLRLNLSLSP